MIIIASKIRLDAMSKVISFSISDRYLDKLRSLYPALTDNLAAKQFLTDGLESSLGNSLDGSLDDGLDGKLKSLIESELDGLLDERLDAVVGKSLTSLSERMARLEERLDDSLDGSLDVKLDYGLPYQPSKDELTETQRRVLESRQLAKAKLEHAAYLVKNPLVVRDLTKKQPIETADKVETAIETVEAVTVKDETATDTVEAVDTVESVDEPVQPAIGPVPGDSIDTEPGKGKGMTAKDAAKYLRAKKVKVSDDSLHRWIRQEKIPNTSPQGRDARKHLILRDGLYYPIN